MLKLLRSLLAKWYLNVGTGRRSLRVTRWGRERAFYTLIDGRWAIYNKDGDVTAAGLATTAKELDSVRELALD